LLKVSLKHSDTIGRGKAGANDDPTIAYGPERRSKTLHPTQIGPDLRQPLRLDKEVIALSIVKELLKPVAEDGAALTRLQARAALVEILDGQAAEVETAALLTALATRGELAPELAGFVEEMRARATPIPLTEAERDELVDTCGTGGGGPATFNISTGAALVAAAAGAKVAKHGNRAVTSRCGSADVL
jgi:hypothetical protein